MKEVAYADIKEHRAEAREMPRGTRVRREAFAVAVLVPFTTPGLDPQPLYLPNAVGPSFHGHGGSFELTDESGLPL